MLDSSLCRNDSERAGKVNLRDQSRSGFIYYFPCYRRLIRQDSAGGGFWRAEGFLAAPDRLGTAGCQWWGQGWRARAEGWGSCAVPASLSQSRSLGWAPLGRERGGQGRDGHGLKPSFAGQGRGRRSCKPMRAAALLRCGARECSESSVQLFV